MQRDRKMGWGEISIISPFEWLQQPGLVQVKARIQDLRLDLQVGGTRELDPKRTVAGT